jgi:CHAD domain-containing protein
MVPRRSLQERVFAALYRHVEDAQAVLGATRRPVDERVHEARKALKRARSVLRLLRGVIGERRFRAQLRALRDAGRSLARLRDARVVGETLAAFVVRSGLDPVLFEPLADALRRERTVAVVALASVDGERDVRRTLGRSLNVLRRAEAAAAFDATQIPDGMRRLYRRARHAYVRARDEPTPETLHAWRKAVKAHADALEACSTAATGGRKESRRLELRTLHALAQLLGDDHDAAVLAARVRAGDVAPLARDRLLAAIGRRTRRLRKRAFREAGPLYRLKPRAYLRTLGRTFAAGTKPASRVSPRAAGTASARRSRSPASPRPRARR